MEIYPVNKGVFHITSWEYNLNFDIAWKKEAERILLNLEVLLLSDKHLTLSTKWVKRRFLNEWNDGILGLFNFSNWNDSIERDKEENNLRYSNNKIEEIFVFVKKIKWEEINSEDVDNYVYKGEDNWKPETLWFPEK